MKTSLWSKLLTVLLCVLLLAGCSGQRVVSPPSQPRAVLKPVQLPVERAAEEAAPEEQPNAPVLRGCTDFGEMTYIRPDLNRLPADLRLLYGRYFGASSVKEREHITKQINERLLHFLTMYALCDLHNAMDVTDSFYASELEALTRTRIALSDITRDFYQKLMLPEHQSLRTELLADWELEDIRCSLRTGSSETVSLREEEAALVREYAALAAGMTGLDPDELYTRYYGSASGIFLRLCENRHAQAKALGYPSFAQLAYDRMGRTAYTMEDVGRFRDYVKHYMTPVYTRLFAQTAARNGLSRPELFLLGALAETPAHSFDQEPLLDCFGLICGEMSPEAGECFDYMRQHSLFDLTPAQGRSPGGFMTYLYDYASPFIFGSFYGSPEDVSLFSHEFGHAFAAWHKIDPSPAHFSDGDRTMDCREMQSSGMQLLMTRWYDHIYGEDAAAFEAALVVELYGLIIDCCMYDEWQEEVCTRWEELRSLPDPAGALSEIEARLRREYYGELGYTHLERYGSGDMWIAKAHLFETPFYMIDYALAYTVSMQVYLLAREDWDRGFAVYMAMLNAPAGSSFPQVVACGGLDSPFNARSVERIAVCASGLLLRNTQ